MDYSSPRFACEAIDDTVVGVHTSEAPNDDDWAAWIAATRRALERTGSVRVLVYSLGGGTTSKQRSEVNELFKDRPQRVAVMLNSRLARGAVTALSWFNPQIKAFDLEQFEDACVHLSIEGSHRLLVQRAITEMKAKLSI
jgi:hypothetical protein